MSHYRQYSLRIWSLILRHGRFNTLDVFTVFSMTRFPGSCCITMKRRKSFCTSAFSSSDHRCGFVEQPNRTSTHTHIYILYKNAISVCLPSIHVKLEVRGILYSFYNYAWNTTAFSTYTVYIFLYFVTSYEKYAYNQANSSPELGWHVFIATLLNSHDDRVELSWVAMNSAYQWRKILYQSCSASGALIEEFLKHQIWRRSFSDVGSIINW